MIAIVSVLSIGCGRKVSPSVNASSDTNAPTADYDSKGKLIKLSYDRDHDGKIDTWGYMDGARVVRVEVDEDGDGQVDLWEYHNAETAPASPKPPADVDVTLERIEIATRHDGKVSRRQYYEHGVMVRVEEDTDGNGAIDKWETYQDGGLVLLALDSSGRGTADHRYIYNADGSLNREEFDPTGTGSFKAAQ